MPTITLPDTSGLTPLVLPFGMESQAHASGSELSQPAPEVIARFQAAMEEPTTAKTDSAPTTSDIGKAGLFNTPATDVTQPETVPSQTSADISLAQDIRPTTDAKQVQVPTADGQARYSTADITTQLPKGWSQPVVTDTTPVVTDTTPVVTDATPVVADATPVVTDATPTTGTTSVLSTGDIARTVRLDTPSMDTARPEAVPYQADAGITHSQNITFGQDIRPTTDAMQGGLPATDNRTQPPTSNIPTQQLAGGTQLATEATPASVAATPADNRQQVTRTDSEQPVRESVRTIRRTTDDKQVLQATDNVTVPLQAAPIVVPVAPDTAPTAVAGIVSIEIDPTAATAKTHELVDAAAQVADTILVTPSLVHGEGEITIQLKPTVLDGSEIHIEAKGTSITVAVTPATPSVAYVVAQSQAQFEQALVERLPSFQIAVTVVPLKTTRRSESAT